MKIFKRSCMILIVFASTLLYATGTDDSTIITKDRTNSEILNSLSAVDIGNLQAYSTNGFDVCNFRIKSLPSEESGTLYMADGITAVYIDQNLTEHESRALTFNPKDTFVGDAIFTYSAMDVNGDEGTLGTITLPIVAPETTIDTNTSTDTDTDTSTVTVITDDKLNPEMLNTLDAVNILNLSGEDSNGVAVSSYRIKSLPSEESGTLYMADGTTAVLIDQNLTQDEADGLRFDPKETYIGDAVFTYIAIDNNVDGSLGTVTIPLVGPTTGNGHVVTDTKVNPEMINSLPAVDILDLSGKDGDGVAVSSFIIKALATTESGVLYMTDGTTAVVVDQILTKDESDALKFDPKEAFIGEALFTYQAIDVNNIFGNIATVTIPIIDANDTSGHPDHNGSAEGCVCEDYNESLSVMNSIGILLMMAFSTLFGLFFMRQELK